jgi:hypothetical protein
MRKVFAYVEDFLRIEYILYAFWMVFWGLNGLDKFFNGEDVESPFIEGLTRPSGWFGVNRDLKFIDYFDRLGLPEALAIGTLYTFAVLEVMLGLMFALIIYRSIVDTPEQRTHPKMLNRLALKCSMLFFFVFCTGDILFGDRYELWEHGTFMILTLMTYQIYLGRHHEYADVVGMHLTSVDVDRDGQVSTVEYEAFLSGMRHDAAGEDDRS